MKKLNVSRFILLVAMTMTMGMAVVGCGKVSTSLFQNVTIQSHLDPSTGDLMVDMQAQVINSGLIFPGVSIPIIDPNNSGRQLGTISLQRSASGQNLLVVSTDLTGIKLNGISSYNLLPNGTQIPVGNLGQVYSVQVGGGNSRVYVGDNSGSYVLGVAVAIKEFDGLASYLPGVDLFFPFSGGNGVAGIFTGAASGTSGIGLFAQVLPAPAVAAAGLSAKVQTQAVSQVISSNNAPQFQVSSQSNKVRLAQQYLWMMSSNKVKLHVK